MNKLVTIFSSSRANRLQKNLSGIHAQSEGNLETVQGEGRSFARSLFDPFRNSLRVSLLIVPDQLFLELPKPGRFRDEYGLAVLKRMFLPAFLDQGPNGVPVFLFSQIDIRDHCQVPSVV